jgi:hypothetical protein
MRGRALSSPDPSSSCPYSPECVEGSFCELLRPNGVLRSSPVERVRAEPSRPGGRLTPPSQGHQDVLGTAVLALRQPLAQLTDYRAGHAVALEHPEHLLLLGGDSTSLQVPTHPGGQALPQEIHGPSPPLIGRSPGSWYRGALTRLPLQEILGSSFLGRLRSVGHDGLRKGVGLLL